jgi:hypothetical protein
LKGKNGLGGAMNSLNSHDQNSVYHVSPLHYLVFIMRSKKLLSKNELIFRGFGQKHFRTTSGRTDFKRGFADYIHCSNKGYAPILISKLSLGYPHIEYVFPSSILPEESFLLCRYNIAKNRGLFQESISNGYCHDDFKIPVAKFFEEKKSLLEHYGTNHIEILIRALINLSEQTTIRAFREEDLILINKYLVKFKLNWKLELSDPQTEYQVKASKDKEVVGFLEQSFHKPSWLGSGLEYDR